MVLDSVDRDAAPSVELDPASIQDAVPRAEAKSRLGNMKSYEVFGKTYKVMDSASGYVEEGGASWYGTKFHGRRTSNWEVFDTLGMTAAHRSLPLPTYVRVTNLDNNKQAIVRVNDRGPFHEGRIIDLSYAGAVKLGFAKQGTARVRVEALDPKTYQPSNPESDGPKMIMAQQKAPVAAASKVEAVSASSRTVTVERVSSEAIAAANSNPATGAAIEKTQSTSKSSSSTPIVDRLYLQVGAYGKLASANSVKTKVESLLDAPVIVATNEHTSPVLHRVRIGPFANAQHLERVKSQLNDADITGAMLVSD